jgi:ribonuclease HII
MVDHPGDEMDDQEWLSSLHRSADDLLAGVDEAGRGPLAGPVVAAAVILDPRRPIEGLADSKKIAPKKRERIAGTIRERALAWSIAEASVEEIDRLNILRASLQAMVRAVRGLHRSPRIVLVDGNHIPDLEMETHAVVGGDDRFQAISAASILAKVERDRIMCELDVLYPNYGFARHKGYPTPVHLQALRQHGAAPVHRRSFAPVRRVLGR